MAKRDVPLGRGAGTVVSVAFAGYLQSHPNWATVHPYVARWLYIAALVSAAYLLISFILRWSWGRWAFGVHAPGGNHHNAFPDLPTAAQVSPRLEIIAAHYGVQGEREADVKNYLLKKPHDNAFAELVSGDLFDGFDPVPGRIKSLTVQYVFDGLRGTVTRSENEWLIIPEDALLKFQLASCRDGIAAREEQFQLGNAQMQSALRKCDEEKRDYANRCMEYRAELARYTAVFSPLQIEAFTIARGLREFLKEIGPRPDADWGAGDKDDPDWIAKKLAERNRLQQPYTTTLVHRYASEFAPRVKDLMHRIGAAGAPAWSLEVYSQAVLNEDGILAASRALDCIAVELGYRDIESRNSDKDTEEKIGGMSSAAYRHALETIPGFGEMVNALYERKKGESGKA